MEIAITCRKCDVDRILTSLECEGYRVSLQPIPIYQGDTRETTPYFLLGERSDQGRRAREELLILQALCWFKSPSLIRTCTIVDDTGTHAQWPTSTIS